METHNATIHLAHEGATHHRELPPHHGHQWGLRRQIRKLAVAGITAGRAFKLGIALHELPRELRGPAGVLALDQPVLSSPMLVRMIERGHLAVRPLQTNTGDSEP